MPLMDYPDINHLPLNLFLNIEVLEPYIAPIMVFNRPHCYQELEVLTQEVVSVVTLNSNYEDSLNILVLQWREGIKSGEDVMVFEMYSNYMYQLAILLSHLLKQSRLYALDDTCYYKFERCLNRHTIVLVRKDPPQYWGDIEL